MSKYTKFSDIKNTILGEVGTPKRDAYESELQTEIDFLDFKKTMKLSDEDIAEWFGYKSANSFRNSTRYEKVINGITKVVKLFSNDT